MHVDYAIPVSVYFKEGRVGVLETKRTRQRTSLPYLLTTQSHPPAKTRVPTVAPGDPTTPGFLALDASPGSGQLGGVGECGQLGTAACSVPVCGLRKVGGAS